MPSVLNQLVRRAAAPGYAASIHPTYLIQTFQSFARLDEATTIRTLSPHLINVIPSLIPTQLLAIIDVHRQTRAIDPEILRLIINRINAQRRSTPIAHMSELMQVAHSAGFHGTFDVFMEEFQTRILAQSNVLTRDDITSYVLPVVAMLKKQNDVVEDCVNETLVRIAPNRADGRYGDGDMDAEDVDAYDEDGNGRDSPGGCAPLTARSPDFGPTSWNAIERSLARIAPERHPALHRALVHLTQARKQQQNGATPGKYVSREAAWESGYGRGGPSRLASSVPGGAEWGGSTFEGLPTSALPKPLAAAVTKGMSDASVITRLKKWFDTTEEKLTSGTKTPKAVECALAIMLCALGPVELREHCSAVSIRVLLVRSIASAYTKHRSASKASSGWVLAAVASFARWGALGPSLSVEERTAAVDLLAESSAHRREWVDANVPFREKQAERMAWRLLLTTAPPPASSPSSPVS